MNDKIMYVSPSPLAVMPKLSGVRSYKMLLNYLR